MYPCKKCGHLSENPTVCTRCRRAIRGSTMEEGLQRTCGEIVLDGGRPYSISPVDTVLIYPGEWAWQVFLRYFVQWILLRSIGAMLCLVIALLFLGVTISLFLTALHSSENTLRLLISSAMVGFVAVVCPGAWALGLGFTVWDRCAHICRSIKTYFQKGARP